MNISCELKTKQEKLSRNEIYGVKMRYGSYIYLRYVEIYVKFGQIE